VGRPPYGSTVDANGDTIVPNCTKNADGTISTPKAPAKNDTPKVAKYYIDLNPDGTEISRRLVGPGKRGKDYVKNSDGNWVRTIKPQSDMKDAVTGS
jgi:hypothetical protein